MSTLSSIEDACETKGITLAMHPAIRHAIQGYEESFYVGAACFLRGETDGLYYLPLDRGYVRLHFSKRWSIGSHPILRIDPETPDGLVRIKAALADDRL